MMQINCGRNSSYDADINLSTDGSEQSEELLLLLLTLGLHATVAKTTNFRTIISYSALKFVDISAFQIDFSKKSER